MSKVFWKLGNFVYPLPVVMVSCGIEKPNIITIAWTGTICTNPPMVYISVRPERHSHKILMDTKEFVINLVTEELTKKCDLCGVYSGKDMDKFSAFKLTPEKAKKINTYYIKESPVNIECEVKDVIKLGSHDMFIATVLGMDVDEELLDEKGKFHFNKSKPIAYFHGEYRGLRDKKIGKFGYSVEK